MRGKSGILLLLLTCALFPAGAVTITTGFGARESSIETSPVFMSLGIETGPLSFYAQTDSGQIYDLEADIAFLRTEKTRHSFNTSLQLVPSEGGFATFSYIFSHRLSAHSLFLSYTFGIQSGYAFSPYSEGISFTIFPVGSLETGYDDGRFALSLGGTFHLREERSWKPTLSLAVKLSYNFDDQFGIYTRAYAEAAEILTDPGIVIASYGIQAGFIFRGEA